MKKKSLNIDQLKVKSFVTEHEGLKNLGVKGGIKATFACTKREVCDTKSPYDCGDTIQYCDNPALI